MAEARSAAARRLIGVGVVALVASCLPTATGKRALVIQNRSESPITVTVDQGPQGSHDLVVAAQGTEIVAQERVTGCNPPRVLPAGPLAISWSYQDKRACHLTRSEIEASAKWDGESERWTLTVEPSACTPPAAPPPSRQP
jgi:hypothetical protein